MPVQPAMNANGPATIQYKMSVSETPAEEYISHPITTIAAVAAVEIKRTNPRSCWDKRTAMSVALVASHLTFPVNRSTPMPKKIQQQYAIIRATTYRNTRAVGSVDADAYATHPKKDAIAIMAIAPKKAIPA
jgi:hypothetical protein